MKQPETLVGKTVRLTPLATRHWREERAGTVVEQSDDAVVVEYEDGLKRTVPTVDVVGVDSSETIIVVGNWDGIHTELDKPPSRGQSKMVAGDDEPA